MTTVTEARRELAQIAERQAELQAIVDAAPKSLLTPLDINDASGFSIRAHMSASWYAFDNAKAYGEALDTLLMLRHQPGSEAAKDDVDQFVVEIDGLGRGAIINTWSGIGYKMPYISPCFADRDSAQAAISTIGADRILRMFRTLHGVA